MSKVWLLGLVAVAFLVIGPAVAAYGQDGAPAAPKHERKAGDGTKTERPKPPEIVLSAEQAQALNPLAAKVTEAINALQAEAIKALGDKDGRAFVMQSIGKTMRAMRPAGDKVRGERKKGPPSAAATEGAK